MESSVQKCRKIFVINTVFILVCLIGLAGLVDRPFIGIKSHNWMTHLISSVDRLIRTNCTATIFNIEMLFVEFNFVFVSRDSTKFILINCPTVCWWKDRSKPKSNIYCIYFWRNMHLRSMRFRIECQTGGNVEKFALHTFLLLACRIIEVKSAIFHKLNAITFDFRFAMRS